MSLADEVRKLELLRERGDLSEPQFELDVAELLRSVTAASEETIVDAAGQAIGEEIQGGPPPAHLGAYELMELLGQGGMGSVYLAKHLLKPGLFAVKVPRKDFLRRPGFGHHFKKEAGVGLKLDHPGIVRVLDLVIDGEWAAIVMQFVAGPNLEEVLRNNGSPLQPARVINLMEQVLEARNYAHDAGVLHRDLKPKNLLLHPSGHVKVTDFGVAGLIGKDENQMGTMLGTAPYMAPELYTGAARVDQRPDIYALGMTLYKLLVGRLPFGRDMNPYQVLRAKEEGRVPLPADLGVHVPQHLVEVLFRALRPNPMDRFPSCAAFQQSMTEGPRRQSVVPALVTSGPQTIPPSTAIRLDRPMTPSEADPTTRMSDSLSSLPTLDGETRMSAGTLISLLLVTGMVAAVIALALSGDLKHLVTQSLEPRDGGALSEGSETSPTHSEEPKRVRPSRADILEPEKQPGGTQGPSASPRSDDREGARGATADRQKRKTARERRAARAEARRKRAASRSRKESTQAAENEEAGAGTPPRGEMSTAAATSRGEERVEEGTAGEGSLPSTGDTNTSAATSPVTAPAPTESVTPTQPEGPAMGFLYLSAQPECEVSIDGKSYGTTEKTSRGLILREGSYKVRFVCHTRASSSIPD